MADDRDLVAGELTVGGRARTFMLRLPSPGRAEVPLVLALHGNHPDAGGWIPRTQTTYGKHAEARGFAMAYPDGFGGCWADGRGVTTAEEAGVDDVAFLRALIDWSADRYGTAPDLTVVAGMSNGAFMAHRLALEVSDRVAVMAAVAGGLPERLLEIEPAHAVSAMLIHGAADTISPIEGGYSRHRGPNGELRGRTVSLDETAVRWRAIDGCPDGPGAARTTTESERRTWDGGVGGTQVVSWTVFGGGHTWPGSPPVAGWSEPATQEFDAAEEICRFAEPLLVPATERLRGRGENDRLAPFRIHSSPSGRHGESPRT